MKNLLRAALVALVVCAGAACNDDSLPPAAGYAAVSGTIVDAATNKPVAGAIVTVDTVLTATTDATGKFAFEKVPSGIVDYTVQATGYRAITASANVEPGKPFELDVSLTSTP
ncbi:MAG: carboxypeptidase regulatory-like domain-containing protein [Candidatus Eremiobacteraeota bacterium]|nr:carboxypeptidase regulatory-like domain-containing protein [Candidatus Eremiobacteraeota bacterium]